MGGSVAAPVKGIAGETGATSASSASGATRGPGAADGAVTLAPVTLVPAGDAACNYEYSYDDLFTERLRTAGQPVTHLQVPLPPEYVTMTPAELDARIAAARAALGAAFDTEWDRGARLGPEEAVALAACGGFVRPADTRWDALSPAECQVVNLVAEGLTTTDIAERLGISPHTVRSHLRSVFAKLGLPNRAALVEEVQGR